MISNTASLVAADRQVRAVFDEVHPAWAVYDGDAFVAPCAETAAAVLPGTYLPGREAIRSTMATLFFGGLQGSTGVHVVQGMWFVGGNVATVISKGPVLLPVQAEPDVAARALETWVLSMQDGTARAQTFHNCRDNIS